MRFFEDKSSKRIFSIFIIVTIITALVFTIIFLWYNNKLTKEAELSILNMSYADNNLNTNSISQNTQTVSFTEDKNINSSVNIQNNLKVEETANSNTSTNIISNEIKEENIVNNTATAEGSVQEEQFEGQEIEVGEYVLEFEAPISGDIIKDFAQESLVYSKTLDEWTTHLGIDIKAEKTAVIKAAERGTIESIKNDPRYGLTIIIAHEDGYKTVYSNLLSTEFVAIGDNVEKGQGIGTVGDTSSFEVADEPHLHFEMYTDGVQVNPTIYLK